jgi:hypothetical protein
MESDWRAIREFKTQDGIPVRTGLGYWPPSGEQPRQRVGMPSTWVCWGSEDWRRLDIYCNRIRRLFEDAIALASELTLVEFVELINECLDRDD